MFQIQSLDHVALTVKDRQCSIEWYQAVLGMERRYQDVWNGPKDPVVMCSGSACIALFLPDTAEPLPSPDHNTLAMRHFALRLDHASFELARVEFRRRGIEFEFEDHTVSHSVYVYDPDGHRIELTTYEL